MAISKRQLLIINDSSKHSPELQLPNTHQQLSMITKKDDCSSQHYLPELESSSTHGHQEASIFDHWCFLKTILLYSITKQPPPTRTRIFQHSWSSAACQLLHEHCVELFFLGRVGSGKGRSKIVVVFSIIIIAALQTNRFVLHLPGVGPFPPLLDSSHDNQNENCLQTTSITSIIIQEGT